MFKKKLIIPLCLLILILAGGGWQLYVSQHQLSEKDKSAAYERLLGRDLKQGTTIETKEYQGTHFAFNYPSNVSERQNQATESDAPVVESVRLISFEPRLNLTIIVAKSDTPLDENSAVKFRLSNQEYSQTESTIAREKALLFTKKDEKSAFFQMKDQIYSLVVTGNSSEEVEKLFETVSQSFSVK